MRKLLLAVCLLSAQTALAADAPKRRYPPLTGLIKSAAWRSRPLLEEEEYTGDVSYRDSEYLLKSDRAVYQRAKGVLTLTGNVDGTKLWKDASLSHAWADKGVYKMDDDTSFLEPQAEGGRVKLFHSDPQRGKWTSLSKTAFFDGKTRLARLEENVAITGESAVSQSDTALYNYNTSLFNLYGNPVITGRHEDYDYAVRGDTAAASGFFTRFRADGNVKGWIKSRTGSLENYGTARSRH